MPIDNTQVIVAWIVAVSGLIGGGFTMWQQLKKDQQTNSYELQQLKRELEGDLWQRAHVEFDKMQARLDDQEATIKEITETSNKQAITIQEQGGLIMHLRQTIQDQDNRIEALEVERDNWKSRALAAEGVRGKRL